MTSTATELAEVPMDVQQLIVAARQAQQHAYARYSNFRVGCALLCADGTLVKGTFVAIGAAGCNVENASYGGTICAERTAYCSAVSTGHTTFSAVAVVTDLPEPAFPCGLCRQFMVEFGDVPVYASSTSSNRVQMLRLHQLLPAHFGPTDLDVHNNNVEPQKQ